MTSAAATEVDIVITKIRGPMIEVDVRLNDHQGNLLSTAKSKLIAPDEAYHAWWAARQPSA